MRFPAAIAALTFSAGLIFPAQSMAAEHVTLTFLGVASSGIDEGIYPYTSAGEAALPAGGHYDGPVSINVSISDFDTNPYVDAFSIKWADAPNGPYYNSWQGAGSDSSIDLMTPTYVSDLALDQTGGSIKIQSTYGYTAFYDGSFTLDLNFALNDPQTFLTSFKDDLSSGGGTVSGSTNMSSYPGVGFFDSNVRGGFSLSSVSAVVSSVPEPGAWAMMIAGFFGLGAMLRLQRRSDRAAA